MSILKLKKLKSKFVYRSVSTSVMKTTLVYLNIFCFEIVHCFRFRATATTKKVEENKSLCVLEDFLFQYLVFKRKGRLKMVIIYFQCLGFRRKIEKLLQ